MGHLRHSDKLGGENKIGFVFAIGRVGDKHSESCTKGSDCLFNTLKTISEFSDENLIQGNRKLIITIAKT